MLTQRPSLMRTLPLLCLLVLPCVAHAQLAPPRGEALPRWSVRASSGFALEERDARWFSEAATQDDAVLAVTARLGRRWAVGVAAGRSENAEFRTALNAFNAVARVTLPFRARWQAVPYAALTHEREYVRGDRLNALTEGNVGVTVLRPVRLSSRLALSPGVDASGGYSRSNRTYGKPEEREQRIVHARLVAALPVAFRLTQGFYLNAEPTAGLVTRAGLLGKNLDSITPQSQYGLRLSAELRF